MSHVTVSRLFCLLSTLVMMSTDISNAAERTYLSNRAYGEVPEQYQLLQASDQRALLDLCGPWLVGAQGEKPEMEVWVPGCTPDQGTYEFQRTFRLDSTFTDKHIQLVAEGINYKATVRLNDRVLETHFGGYTKWIIGIPPDVIVWNADNVLSITVENELSVDHTLPTRQRVWGWRNYGGIFREIYLRGLPMISINDVTVDCTFDSAYSAAQLNVDLAFQNHQVLESAGTTGRQSVDNVVEIGYGVSLIGPDGTTVAASTIQRDPVVSIQHSGSVSVPLTVPTPQLWSTATPNMYTLQVSIYKDGQITDLWSNPVGLRDLKISQGNLILNGEHIRLQTILYHEDAPGIGASMNWRTLEADIIKMKTLGINAIQTGLYPCHPYLYTLCDRYGLMALETLPIWNLPAVLLEQPEIRALARQFATEMIQRDRLHPSIISWGLGFGMPVGHPGVTGFVTELKEYFKELDSRPVYLSTNSLQDDPALVVADILAPSPFNPDPQTIAQSLTTLMRQYPEKPVLLGRIGTDLFPENFDGGYSDPTSLEHQGRYIQNMLQALQELESLDGQIFWTLTDWMGDRPLLTNAPHVDPYLYPLGLLDYQRRERIGYTVLQSFLTDQEQPNLYAGAQAPDEPQAFRLTGIAIIVVLAMTMRGRKRFGGNIKRSIVFTQGFFDDITRRRYVPGGQTILLSITGAAVCSTLASAFLHFYRRDHIFDMLLDQLVPAEMLKEMLTWLAWNPWQAIMIGMIFCYILMTGLALLLMVSTLFSRRMVSLRYAWNTSVWGGVIWLLLLPLAMGLYAVLQYPWATLSLIGLLCLFACWHAVRIIHALAIYTRSSVMHISVSLGLLSATLATLVATYMQYQYAVWQYIVYVYQMMQLG
jgi:hypothetical protein